MMKNKKIILIILGIGMFFAMPVFANDNLVVDFQNTPLFNEANFLPSESIARWAKVTNNSGQTERIAVEAINVNDPNGFGNALTLEIKEGNDRLYNGPLSQFFNAGEVYLSDLGEGGQTQYDFSITFYPEASNTFQGKTLGFDILIGFQGTGGGLAPGGGGGGGGFLPPGLTIFEPIEIVPGTISATITWETSYKATSEIVYGSESEKHSFDLTAENYGYEHTSGEYPNKVIVHTVTITGLSPGTTYYYRCVSHGSFALSTEHSFITLAETEGGDTVFIDYSEGDEEKKIVQGEVKGSTYIAGSNEEKKDEKREDEDEEDKEETAEESFLLLLAGGFLASMIDSFKLMNPYLLLSIFIIILIILFLLFRRKRIKSS